MKKIDKIFITLIIIESIIILITSLISIDYSTPCDVPNISNLISKLTNKNSLCAQVITAAKPVLFYTTIDILILTAISYLIFRKLKIGK